MHQLLALTCNCFAVGLFIPSGTAWSAVLPAVQQLW